MKNIKSPRKKKKIKNYINGEMIFFNKKGTYRKDL